MARVEILLPKQCLFSTDIALHLNHINWGGHLDSAQLLVLVSEARERFFTFFGYSQRDIEGLSVVMADGAQRYLSEGFYGDIMTVEIGVAEWFQKGFELVWRMTNLADGKAVALGKSTMLFMDLSSGTARQPPVEFRQRLRNTDVNFWRADNG